MRDDTPRFADPRGTRRAFLARAAAGAAGLAGPRTVVAPPGAGGLSVTGVANANLKSFDELMTAFLAENKVPGAALAVTYRGRLAYARGFGYADTDAKEPVRPAAPFRVASVSKPITAVAVMRLVEQGKLKLDDEVAGRMKLTPFVAPGATADPRWGRVTVRQCLQHTGGWDRDKSFDPIGRPREIAKALGTQLPVTPEQVVRYMMGRPLDFDPGERHAYSNLGYLVLGRVVEAVTGQAYEAYVRKEVLAPLGVKSARLGRALAENRLDGEVRYYDREGRAGPAVIPPRLGQQVPLPYGAENFEAYEAHGGWVASAVDLVKFAAAFDNPSACPVLSAKSIGAMWARPDGAAGRSDGKPAAAYYGCGWMVRPVGAAGKRNAWHSGFIAGTESLLVRRHDGLTWAVLFNTHNSPDGKSLSGLIDGRLHEAADRVKVWPKADQFGEYLRT